jgi:hypothetical protein
MERESMKDFDWRKKFAPNGYAWVRERVSFETLGQSRFPKDVLSLTMERMEHKLLKDCPYFFAPSAAHTRISVFPKDVGETVNHLDPLKPRFGIEIEIRQPMPPDHRQ